MKALILVLLAFAVTGAQAKTLPNVKNKIVTAKELKVLLAERPIASIPKNFLNKIRSTPGAALVTPIRHGKYKAEIYKMEIKKLPDNTYQYSNSSVCILNGTAPVYDFRGMTGPIELPPTVWDSCASTVGGQPASVDMEATVFLNEGRMFSDEPESSFKNTFPNLRVMVGTNINQWSGGYTFTRDLAQSSALGFMGAESIEVCKPAEDGSGDVVCTVTEGEFFSANFEILD